MLTRNISALLFICVAAQLIALGDSGAVHEWGTFTSVADRNGAAMAWEALSGPSDLPCFVHRLDQRNLKAAAYGTVRMETPVIYFYPLKPMAVSVHVQFPNGRITEWYPQASSVQSSTSSKGWIQWDDVQLRRIAEPPPNLGVASHYYAARITDGWPLTSAQESEKLLFYRGIADFGVDLRPVVDSHRVLLRNAGSETIPEVIVFENYDGHSGFHVIHALREPVSVDFSDLTGTLDGLRTQFENELVEMGLYRKEAHAMLETWRDSWFEEGLRVFYIVPRSKVDTLLPISIRPEPAQLVRVFVGRVELLSPRMKVEISRALQDGEVAVLKKYGRFLNAFLREMNGAGGEPPMNDAAREFLEKAYTQALVESRQTGCIERQ